MSVENKEPLSEAEMLCRMKKHSPRVQSRYFRSSSLLRVSITLSNVSQTTPHQTCSLIFHHLLVNSSHSKHVSHHKGIHATARWKIYTQVGQTTKSNSSQRTNVNVLTQLNKVHTEGLFFTLFIQDNPRKTKEEDTKLASEKASFMKTSLTDLQWWC